MFWVMWLIMLLLVYTHCNLDDKMREIIHICIICIDHLTFFCLRVFFLKIVVSMFLYVFINNWFINIPLFLQYIISSIFLYLCSCMCLGSLDRLVFFTCFFMNFLIRYLTNYYQSFSSNSFCICWWLIPDQD